MILYKVQKYFPTDDMNKFIECDIYSVDDFERERKRLLNKYKSNSFYSNRRTGFYG